MPNCFLRTPITLRTECRSVVLELEWQSMLSTKVMLVQYEKSRCYSMALYVYSLL